MAFTLETKALRTSLTIGDDYAKENAIEFTVTITASGDVWLTLQIPIGEDGVLRSPEDTNTIVIATPGTLPAPAVRLAETGLKEWTLGDPVDGDTVNGT